RVLLRLVEAMDLVDEDDRPLPLEGQAVTRRGDDLAELGDTPEDGAEGHEVRTGDRGDDERQGRLPAAWRPPEDPRPEPAAGDRLRQHRVRPEEVLLTEDPLERARPHPI